MPRPGSREWNRQQNLRRQRQEEQIIQAQVIIQHADQVVVQAEPIDNQNLQEQIQNKITQIEQLKTNTKEFKKQIKALKKVNDMMLKDNSILLKNNRGIVEDIKSGGYYKRRDTDNSMVFDSNFKFALVDVNMKAKKGIDKERFEEWKKKHPNTTQQCAFTFELSTSNTHEKSLTQNYINYLETLIMSNSDVMESIGGGHDFKEFINIYDCDMDEFLKNITPEGKSCKKNITPECVICGGTCEYKYGNNPAPVKDEGVCCNACNDTIVIPARMDELMK